MSISNQDLLSGSVGGFWDELEADTILIGPSDISDFNPENILPESDATRASIHSWLSPTQYDGDGSEYQTHLSSHLPGTGNWVFDSNIYQQWHDSDDYGILWIRGIPAVGKSVLASTLIHRLKQEGVPVLYFFFRFTFETNNNPEALLRDWLAQVLKYSPPIQHELSARASKGPLIQNLSLADLFRYLHRALMYLPKAYCVIDAMDEMNPEHLEQLVRSLDALGRWRPAEIKLVVTSRPVAVVEKIFSRGVKTLDVRLDKKRVEGDIAHYVQHRLSLSLVPPESHPEIEQAILQRVDGLFLYAKLALDSLLQSDMNVPTNLAEIPADLTKMYTNLLQEHSRKTIGVPDGLQEFVLQLVTHATRRLRLLEIADLVRVTQKQDDLGAIKDLIRSLCGPLLEILPDETVRIVHHSLTEYLTGMTSISNAETRIFPVFEFGVTHHRLATACLSYLASGCLDSVNYSKRRRIQGDVNYIQPASLDTDQLLSPFTRYAGSNWAVHVRRAMSAGQAPNQINEILDSLLVEPNLDKIDVLIETLMDFQPTPLHFAIGLELQDYAKHLLSNRKPEHMKEGRLEDSLILYAATKGSDFMVKLLIDHGADPISRNDRGRTPLHIAVTGDHTKVSAVLIDAGVDPDIVRGDDHYFGMPGESEKSWTPLEHVFARGSFDMVMVFYQRLQSPEIVTKALYQAISDQNTRAIKLLLRHPKLDITADYQGTPHIFAACLNRDMSTIELLLESGAVIKPRLKCSEILEPPSIYAVPAFEDAELDDVDFETGIKSAEITAMNAVGANTTNENCRSDVLHAWARPNRKYPEYKLPKLDDGEVGRGIRLLLAHGANVHQVNEKGETPLHLASDAATARSLLEGGADPNAVNLFGGTLLHVTNTEEILDILLPMADLNMQTRYTKRTPLLFTMIEGLTPQAARVEKALRLIDSGADINAVDKYGNSALHLAVGMEDVAKVGIPLIEKLCSSGADVNLKNYQGKTPLHMNAPGSGRVSSIGHDQGKFNAQILRILLAAGADINARDSWGKPLLFQYIENGSSYSNDKKSLVFDTIAQAGAKIDTLDSRGRSLLHAQVFNVGYDISFLEHMTKKGVNPTHTDYEGNTLLHEAAPQLAKRGLGTQSTLVEKLIEMGVDPRKPNHVGRTPLHLLASINPGCFDSSNSYTSHGLGSRPSNADDPCGFDFYLRLCPDLMDRADNHGVRPLHLASTFSEYMTRRLLEEGASPSQATQEGLTPLHLAAQSRQANIIGILLDKLQSTLASEEIAAVLNTKDVLNRTALYYAAASGRVESFQLLLDAGAALDHDSYTGSAWNGCEDFEEELGNWPHRSPSIYRILKRQTDNHVKVSAGGVMISHTARPQPSEGGHLKESLFPSERLDEILDILAYSVSKGQTGFVDQAIASAAEKGHDYTVECLLRARERLARDTKVDLDENTQACLSRRQETRSALGSASDRSAIVRLMKLRDYDLVSGKLTPANCLECTGRDLAASPLASQFVSGGFATLVSNTAFEEIVRNTEWREKQDRKVGWNGLSMQPLLTAACSREMPNMDVIRILVEGKKANVNAGAPRRSYPNDETPDGPTALHYLAEGQHWWQVAQAIPYLVQHGADLDAVENENGLTPLGYALRSINGPRFSKRAVETLLAYGASPNGANRHGNSYLSFTIERPEIFQLLIQYGAVINRSALEAAINQQDVDLVQMLLSNGADPNERKVGEERPQIWLSENSFRMATSDPDTNDELYLIHWVAGALYRPRERDREIDDRIVKMLLEHGANPFAPYLRTTVLHQVMENRVLNTIGGGQNRQLDLLLDQPGLDFNTRDADGKTLLLLAVNRGFNIDDESIIRVTQRLLDRGADIYARDHKGRSALHYACPFKNRCDFILGKAPELINSPDHEGKTPLHRALVSRDAAGALITAGADVTHQDHEGKTPLHLALDDSEWVIHADGSIGGYGRDIFDRLVARGANVNARTHAGEPPIFGYVRNSRIRAETDLSQLGPYPEKEYTNAHSSWIMAKARMERAAAVEKEDLLWTFFEQHGVELNAFNEAGEGPLHLIAQNTNSQQINDYPGRGVARFKYLMEKGHDPAAEDKEHQTPLDVAAALRKEELLALFKRDE